jgi:hypothetical protein
MLAVREQAAPLSAPILLSTLAGAGAAITCCVLARVRGGLEIRDATWGLLTLEAGS